MALKSEQFRQQASAELAMAKAIAERANADRRDLTEAEHSTFQRHYDEAKRLNELKKRSQDDEATVAFARQLDDEIGLSSGVPATYSAPGGAGGWGAKVVAANSSAHGFKALLPAGSVPVSVPLAAEPVRDSEPVRALRQLVEAVAAPGGHYAYMKQSARTNNAAAVAYGALKPTSIFTLTRVDDRTRTVAHLSEAIPRQHIADAPLLERFVDDELRLGLDLALDQQILNGSGVGENLTGILSTSGIQAQPFATDILTTTRKAITALEGQNLAATGWVFRPTDWERVELAAVTAYVGNNNQGAPVDAMARRLWGVPVVVTNAIPANTALLGDFATGAKLHITEDARVDWSENVTDDFQKNLIRFRCEGRFGLEVSRALAFVSVALVI